LEKRDSFRDPLVEKQLEQGNANDILNILLFAAYMCLQCGDWDTLFDARRMLDDVLKRFDSDTGRAWQFLLIFIYYLKRRMSGEASTAIAGLLKFCATVPTALGGNLLAHAHALSSRVGLLCGDLEWAVADLNRAFKEDPRSWGSVLYDGFSYGARAAVAVERARRAAAEGKLDRATRRECLASLRRYLKNTRKCAPELTESLKFFGSYWWHAGSHRRALSYWRQSIQAGERIGAKVELAHTFADAGALLGEIAPGPEWRKRGAEMYTALGIGENR
jgi:tetratricopeptide (TPR) repeat protein